MERLSDLAVESARGCSRRRGEGARVPQIARSARLGTQARDPGAGGPRDQGHPKPQASGHVGHY